MALIKRLLDFYPQSESERLFGGRKRPRRRGKPL